MMGCDSMRVEMIKMADDVDIDLELEDVSCHGLRDGTITITSLSGGVAPYIYALGDYPYQTNPLFGNLDTGTYVVRVEDTDGCQFEKEVVIQEPPLLEIDVSGSDIQSIQLGDSIVIEITGIAPESVHSIRWNGDMIEDCETCPSTIVVPDFSTNNVI